MAEEHVVGIFLARMLFLLAAVIPFSCPRETRVLSGRMYTSALTQAFSCLAACGYKTCVTVIKRKQDESL